MSAHTPGPWRINDHRQAFAPNGFIVADVRGPSHLLRGKDRREEAECCAANARLIAAAPDLLEALKLARDVLEVEGLMRVVRIADAAIAKATGEAA